MPRRSGGSTASPGRRLTAPSTPRPSGRCPPRRHWRAFASCPASDPSLPTRRSIGAVASPMACPPATSSAGRSSGTCTAGPIVLADDHPLVDLDPGSDEQLGPLLQVEEPIGIARPGSIRDEDPGRPVGDLACPWTVALADLVEQGGPACLRQELAAVADQATNGQDVLEPDPPVGVVGELLQAALAAR